jgi:hypothetical protein
MIGMQPPNHGVRRLLCGDPERSHAQCCWPSNRRHDSESNGHKPLKPEPWRSSEISLACTEEPLSRSRMVFPVRTVAFVHPHVSAQQEDFGMSSKPKTAPHAHWGRQIQLGSTEQLVWNIRSSSGIQQVLENRHTREETLVVLSQNPSGTLFQVM